METGLYKIFQVATPSLRNNEVNNGVLTSLQYCLMNIKQTGVLIIAWYVNQNIMLQGICCADGHS